MTLLKWAFGVGFVTSMTVLALIIVVMFGMEEEYAGGVNCATTVPALPTGPAGQGPALAATAAARAGWTGEDLVYAVMVTGAESTFDPTARNEIATANGRAHGLFQLLLPLHEDLFAPEESWDDPYANARAAFKLWSSDGWAPWLASQDRHEDFRAEAQAAVAALGATTDSAAPDPLALLDDIDELPGLKPIAQQAAAHIREGFGFTGDMHGYVVKTVYGTDKPSKHSDGLAVDVMLDSNDPTEDALGTEIADYFRGPGQPVYAVENVIWKQRIANAGTGWAWRPMEDRGNPTQNHYDHVHVDFTDTVVDVDGPDTIPGCAVPVGVSAGDVTMPLPAGSGYVDNGNYGNTGANWSDGHTGNDYSVACGTPVLAAHSGTVDVLTDQAWSGPWLVKVVAAPDGLATWYAHMEAVDVEAGQQVVAGQQIGDVGSQGNSTGCHLHFEVHPTNGGIYEDGVDPVVWLTQNLGDTAAQPATVTTSS